MNQDLRDQIATLTTEDKIVFFLVAGVFTAVWMLLLWVLSELYEIPLGEVLTVLYALSFFRSVFRKLFKDHIKNKKEQP